MCDLNACYNALDSLLEYSFTCGLADRLDEIYLRNTLLKKLCLDEYIFCGKDTPFPQCLERLCDFAAEHGIINDTLGSRDLFDSELMGVLTPLPSVVINKFYYLYNSSPKNATDYFYKLSQDCNYIRKGRISKDLRWTVESKYGTLELSINLSKPEKDPRDIAAAGLKKSSEYPKCQLCAENEGYSGTLTHPARENLRIIPIDIQGEEWGFQYSPYVYYNEHCIVLNKTHKPMVIDEDVFYKLFSFTEKFPDYFIGSNADLPIVGGSILSHEHFQGGRHEFPMERASIEFNFSVDNFVDVDCAVLYYPLSTIRLTGENKDKVCALAGRILNAWRAYSDPDAFIFAETDGVPHNTVTPIARMKDGLYQLDLILRNNITTPEHPMGVYHPHSELHHIKKENIGLIESMGLAILPGRLKGEMSKLEDMLLSGCTIDEVRANTELAKHADWAESFMAKHKDFNPSNAGDIIYEEIGNEFVKVLECAGVYKCTDEGRTAFRRFLAAI